MPALRGGAVDDVRSEASKATTTPANGQRVVDVNAQKRTRTSTGFYSHQHLKLARLPIPPSGLRIPHANQGVEKYTSSGPCVEGPAFVPYYGSYDRFRPRTLSHPPNR